MECGVKPDSGVCKTSAISDVLSLRPQKLILSVPLDFCLGVITFSVRVDPRFLRDSTTGPILPCLP